MSEKNAAKREKIAVVRSVTSKLHAAEEAVDMAIQRLAELAIELPAARAEIGISAIVGHDVFVHVANAHNSLVSGRGQTVAAHKELAQIQEALGIKITSGGDLWKWFQHSDAPPLSIVSQAA
jgi:hypothetical protein